MKAALGMTAGAIGSFVGTPAELALIRMTSKLYFRMTHSYLLIPHNARPPFVMLNSFCTKLESCRTLEYTHVTYDR